MNVIDINSVDEIDHPPPKKVRQLCNCVLTFLNHNRWELSVFFCDNAYIQSLNKRYLDHDYPTDILSFPQNHNNAITHLGCSEFSVPSERNNYYYAGDIVISTEQVRINADQYKVQYEEELKRLLIHGILHLKGMDHTYTDMENQEMITLQEEILKSIEGVSLS